MEDTNNPFEEKIDNTTAVESNVQEKTVETTDANKALESKGKCTCKCNPTTCLLVCNIVLLVGLALLYVFHFTGIGTHSKYNPKASAPVMAKDGALRVAYVDSDTLLAKYQYAIDLQKELDQERIRVEKDYQRQMTQFQNDYQNFLKTGETMTLSQQQAKEAELKQRAEKLSTLEAELSNKVIKKQLDSNIELLNRIFAFVREYNEANQQFDIILRKTFTDSPTMYMNPGMDITNEIIAGLNEEYKNVKAKKK